MDSVITVVPGTELATSVANALEASDASRLDARAVDVEGDEVLTSNVSAHA